MLAVIGMAGAGLPAAADGPLVAPHRAVYEMTLDTLRGGGTLTGISGRLVYEVLGSPCEGHTLNRRFVSEISNDEVATTSDQRLTSFEEGDGSAYRFIARSYFDERLSEAVEGLAVRHDDHVAVELREPREEEIKLPGNVLFPFQYMHRLLEAAQRGDTIVTAAIYEGAEAEHTVYETTAVVGSRRTSPPPVDVPGAEALEGVKSWPVSIAYFDLAEDDATPKYEFSYDLYANGVSTSVFLDYGDFALRGELTEIEFVDSAPCN